MKYIQKTSMLHRIFYLGDSTSLAVFSGRVCRVFIFRNPESADWDEVVASECRSRPFCCALQCYSKFPCLLRDGETRLAAIDEARAKQVEELEECRRRLERLQSEVGSVPSFCFSGPARRNFVLQQVVVELPFTTITSPQGTRETADNVINRAASRACDDVSLSTEQRLRDRMEEKHLNLRDPFLMGVAMSRCH